MVYLLLICRILILGYGIRLQRIMKRQHRQKMRRARLKHKRHNAKSILPFGNSKFISNQHRPPDRKKIPPYKSISIPHPPKIHPKLNSDKKQRSSSSALHLYLHPYPIHSKDTYSKKYMNYPLRSHSSNQNSYRHRFLNLNRPNHYDVYNYPDTSYIDQDYLDLPQRLTSFRIPHIDNFLRLKKQPSIERQGAFIAGTPLAYGAAWFGSMLGLAAIVRQPLSEVMTRFSPWSIFNGILPLKY